MTKTGYQKDNQGVWISKDPLAQLVYSMDWSRWLPQGDIITGVEYSLQVRANDPEPLIKVSSGVQGIDITYVELSGGIVTGKQIGRAHV